LSETKTKYRILGGDAHVARDGVVRSRKTGKKLSGNWVDADRAATLNALNEAKKGSGKGKKK
jgi:hypothetical protein